VTTISSSAELSWLPRHLLCQSEAIFCCTKRWLLSTSKLKAVFVYFERARESWASSLWRFKCALWTCCRGKTTGVWQPAHRLYLWGV